MSKKQYSAEDLASMMALAENRAALEATRERIKAFSASVRGNEAFAENARIKAWVEVGRVVAPSEDPKTWRVPKGWPAPYGEDGFARWLEIHEPDLIKLENDEDVGPRLGSSEERHLRKFREALEGK